MIFLSIIVGIVLGDIAWGWLTSRRLRNRWLAGAAAAWAGLQLLGVLVLLFSRGGLAGIAEMVSRPIWSAVFIWHLLVLPLWLVLNLARGIVALVSKLTRTKRAPAPEAPTGSSMSRREFIGAAAAFTPPMLSLGSAWASEQELDDFRIRRIELPLRELPTALDGLTIAQVTDVHVGRFTRGKVLEQIVAETNRLDADIIALTGDLINDSLRALPQALELVRGLRARHIIAACEGNHDLIENPEKFRREAVQGGLPLLRGEAASVTIGGQRIQFLGLPWHHAKEEMSESARALIALRDPGAWPILLAHHPHAWDFSDTIPLTLSGHTHGGQLMLNETLGAGPAIFRYWSGLYRREHSALFVSNGVGNWFPLRLRAPAEIVHLTLRRASA